MNKPLPHDTPASTEDAHTRWRAEYAAQIGMEREIRNRSGIAIQPLYSPLDVAPGRYDADVGFPGQPPYTRGIYPTMHRGRTWTQRQLIGLGTPETYNARLRDILSQGASAVSLIPCNSVFRGYDMDEVDAELLGTCGVVANSAGHMATCLEGVDLNHVVMGHNGSGDVAVMKQITDRGAYIEFDYIGDAPQTPDDGAGLRQLAERRAQQIKSLIYVA